jgi:hypothetical protein
MTMDSLHPLQLPRIHEIREGKKFWGYLDTVALQTRYVLAAHFLRNTRNIIEIGGYRNNVITRFLTGAHDSVSVFSLDAEFEPLEQESLNGAPCRVRHIHDYFQNYPHPTESLGVVALGIEILGDREPLWNLLGQAEVVVIEVPVDHVPSVQWFQEILEKLNVPITCQINLDYSPNETLLRNELAQTNMNVPFWKRNVYVIEPLGSHIAA